MLFVTKKFRRGMTMIEVLISTAIGAMLIVATGPLIYSVFQSNYVRSWSYTSNYGANIYDSMPSQAQFRNAALMMANFQSEVNRASAVFVIGGFRSAPVAGATSGQRFPLRAGNTFTSITGITNASELRFIQSGYDLDVNYLTGQLGAGGKETSYDNADFTVVCITGLNVVSSITQCRRYLATIDGESLALYEVVIDTDLAAARDSVYGSATQNRWAYRFALPVAEDSWTVPAGAQHYWFRYDGIANSAGGYSNATPSMNAPWDWIRQEEGPCRLVFPDPYLYPGAQPNGDTVPFSRFIFFIPPTN